MKYQFITQPKRLIPMGLIITAALATGAASTYAILVAKSAAQPAAPPSATSQDVLNAVAASGYLEPAGEVIKLSAPAFMEGARVAQLLVQQGDEVEVGQVVAVLDNHDRLQAALAQTQQQVQVAQARLDQVKAGAKTGDINAQAARFQETRSELEGQVTTQQATISRLEAQLEGEQAAQAATIDRIRAELQNAETECGRYEALFQDGAVSASQRDSTCLQQATVQENLREAQANLTRIVATRQAEINEAQANLDRTVKTLQEQIEANRATLESVAEVRPVDVQVAQAELQQAQAAVQQAQAEYDQSLVRSPQNGQILEIHTRPGELVGNDGIVDLGQTHQIYVRAEVYETDISRVKVGQSAVIRANGIVGDLHGTVDEVGLQIGRQDTLGTDPVADADARVVEVKIRLTPEDSQQVAGLTNLQVNVVINTTP